MLGQQKLRLSPLLAVLLLLGSTAQAETDNTFCWKQNYGRGAGGVGKSCPANSQLKDGLCYPNCDLGYDAVGTVCWQTCPSGFTNIGVSCQKPSGITYNGYGWQGIGDGLTLDAAKRRCEHDYGSGNCHQSGLLWYPNCPANYEQATVNTCTPVCPNGMRNDGLYCAKQTKDRGTATIPTCGSGLESDAGLCYPACGNGFSGVGPVCWGTCPADRPVQCGAACATSAAACEAAVGDMVMNTTAVALNILSMAFGGPGVGAAVKAAAKAGESAAVDQLLTHTATTWPGMLAGMGKEYALAYGKEFAKATLKNTFDNKNFYWNVAKKMNSTGLSAMNKAATEEGVLKQANAFDLDKLSALDPTGISSMVLSFTKYGSCTGGDDFLVDSRELNFGNIGSSTQQRNVTITAQTPMTITRITSPAFSNCSITPDADCIGKQLLPGQTCQVKVAVNSPGNLESEIRIYTTDYSTIPFAVHVLANQTSKTTCNEVPGIDETVNLTSIAGAWAWNKDQSKKLVIKSDGSATTWTGSANVEVQDAAARGFTVKFPSGPSTVYLDDLSESLLTFTAPQTGPITAMNSNKVLDVAGISSADGAQIIQWDSWGGANQTFTFDSLGDGSYRIVAGNSGKVFDVSGWSTVSGAKIIQWPWHGGNNQRFRVLPTGDGYFRIVNVNSGKVLAISGGSQDNGAELIQWDWTGSSNQKFKLASTQTVQAVKRPWDGGCAAGNTSYAGLCYDVPPDYAMTTPGIMGKPCPADWRDDGSTCYPPWTGVSVASQADPNGDYLKRHPIVVTDCGNYAAARGQQCPANFVNVGGPGSCSCQAQTTSKDIKTISGTSPTR